ncbi:MAG: hypothetical protein HYT87_10755 [Nitrospirae bacterium]|nr:hypothetical protein [Nitrospirota bacterium]
MKRRKSNGQRGNGEARTHVLLEQIVSELSSVRREMAAMREDLSSRIEQTNSRIEQTNSRIEHLIEILAPKLKDHEERITKLETKKAA